MNQENLQFDNIPEFSVTELANSVKRTLENAYGRVRVRGEIGRISLPASGHLYTNLKEDKATIDAVCWKGNLSKLSVRPEEGMEVICIGRITTFGSKYQLVIESLELAGEGALLKMLEDRRKKLAAEGLFAQKKKQSIPFLPNKIGIVTSPSGAVIRDIIHRLRDRFPRHAMVWPVKVQGQGAAEEIAAAIAGFDALPDTYRPDVLIVARGGGSLEDLMAFNEEIVVRAATSCSIPLISAVGHETDTTLIDYAADLRAPTPTGAAEMAVPVRMNLMAQVAEDEQRLISGLSRMLSEKRHKLEAQTAKLGQPERLLEMRMQNIDHIAHKLDSLFKGLITHNEKKVARLYVPTPHSLVREKRMSFDRWAKELKPMATRTLNQKLEITEKFGHMLELLSFENILERGYVVVRDSNYKPVTKAKSLEANQSVSLQFHGQKIIGATITGSKESNLQQKSSTKKQVQANDPEEQGSLF
ncbi:MAG: exodeoxyribonuclease VII large subunit [Alphaproteobacteria bacterium]|nr:exodeoxyribonuclease VII large subunit [Alphaproteobacteria bacterium]